jgi:hypothetical protein
VQREARLVLREDAGLDRPDPGVLGRLDQGGEQPAADAAAAGRLGDVHGILDDTGVDAPAGHRRDRGPADDGSLDLRDEAVVGQVRGVPAGPGRDLRLEGRVAGGDALRVDLRHRRPVLDPHRPDADRRPRRVADAQPRVRPRGRPPGRPHHSDAELGEQDPYPALDRVADRAHRLDAQTGRHG